MAGRSSDQAGEESSVFAAGVLRSGEAFKPSLEPQPATSSPRAPDLVFQLAEQIRMQLRDGRSEIRIQLRPENLGRLEIRAESTIDGIAARITAESSAVKTYLENNLQLLQQALQSQDVRVDRIHVIVQDALDAQSYPGNAAQSGHAGSDPHGKESRSHSGSPASRAEEVVAEMAVDPVAWLALNPDNRFYTVA